MQEFIIKLLDSRPHQGLMLYLVMWNDGSKSWVSVKKLEDKEVEL